MDLVVCVLGFGLAVESSQVRSGQGGATTTTETADGREATTSARGVAVVPLTMEREEEEDKKGKMKKSPFSKQVGFVLERENKFFFGMK